MYQDYLSFENIPDETVIWRYMTRDKFISLIRDNEVYFCRADLFSDPWEGLTTNATADVINQEMYSQNAPHGMAQFLVQFNNSFVSQSFVSCWQENQNESDAMWNSYCKKDGGVGVAIKTSVGILKAAIIDDKNYHIGKVIYAHEDDYIHEDGDIFKRLLWKRPVFEYEREIRLLYRDNSAFSALGLPRPSYDKGIFLKQK